MVKFGRGSSSDDGGSHDGDTGSGLEAPAFDVDDRACLKEQTGMVAVAVDQRTPSDSRRTFRYCVLVVLSWALVFAVGTVLGSRLTRQASAHDVSAQLVTPPPTLAPTSSLLVVSPAPEAGSTIAGELADYAFLYSDAGIALLDDFLGEAERTGGPRASLRKAETLMASNKPFMDSCHPLLHRFGRTLYKKAGANGLVASLRQLVDLDDIIAAEAVALLSNSPTPPTDQAVAIAQPTSMTWRASGHTAGAVPDDVLPQLMVCNAAYLHGVIELFLLKVGMVGKLQAGVEFVQNRICSRMQKGWREQWECRHGVGHGIVQFTRHQHIQSALQASLDLASKTPAVSQRAGEVWNGIWMDHFASTEYAGHDADDPGMAIGICYFAGAGNRGQGDCEMYSIQAFLLHRPRAYIPAHRWCQDGCFEAQEGAGATRCESGCVGGVGMQTMKENMDNMVLVGEVCKHARSRQLSVNCIGGATGYYSFAMGHGIPVSRCNQLDEPALRAACR